MVIDPVTSACKINLRWHIDDQWEKLLALIDRLSDDQMTGPADDAGWTVKDHLIHLAVWEDGLNAILNRRSFASGMGFDSLDWCDLDGINAVIQQRYGDAPLFGVLRTLHRSHKRLLDSLDGLTADDLMRPVCDFDPDCGDHNPLMSTIVCNTFGHYDEHRLWIEALVEQRN